MSSIIGITPSPSRLAEFKKYTPTQRDGVLLQTAMQAMESFRTTQIIIFLDLAQQALEDLYGRVHSVG